MNERVGIVDEEQSGHHMEITHLSGLMTLFNQKEKMADDFILHLQPYKEHENLHFDLRRYAKYLKENGLSGKEVSEDIINKFRI